MNPTTITQYRLYFSYSNVPFDNCDADWHLWTRPFDTLEEAMQMRDAFAAENKVDGWEEYYIIMEEVTERRIIYNEADE